MRHLFAAITERWLSVNWPGHSRPHASDRCHLHGWAGSVKAVFACTCTTRLHGCGCPMATDGLGGFLTGPGQFRSGSLDTPPLNSRRLRSVDSGPTVLCFSRQPPGVGAAVAAARAARAARLEPVQEVLQDAGRPSSSARSGWAVVGRERTPWATRCSSPGPLVRGARQWPGQALRGRRRASTRRGPGGRACLGRSPRARRARRIATASASRSAWRRSSAIRCRAISE